MLPALLTLSVARVPLERHDGGHAAHMQRVQAKGWTIGAAAPPTQLVELIVAVRQSASGVEALERAVMAVSDPRSPAYGRHLSNKRVHDLVTPPPAAVLAVHEWLHSEGVQPRNVERRPLSSAR